MSVKARTGLTGRAAKMIGVAATMSGLSLIGLALPGAAAAHAPSASHIVVCAAQNDGSWTATFTVHNDPTGKYGAAKITGTGTTLDGQLVPDAGSLN